MKHTCCRIRWCISDASFDDRRPGGAAAYQDRCPAPFERHGRLCRGRIQGDAGDDRAALQQGRRLNGRPVEIVYYDEEAKPDVAVSVVKRLIQKDQVQAIVGISTSWTAMPVIPVIEQAKVPAILLAVATAIVDPVKPWVFKTVPDDRITVARMLSDMQWKGIERIALTTSQDAFGDGGRTEVTNQAPAHNIKIVFDERYNMDDADITPLLSKIKNTDAQAVVNWSSRRALVVMTPHDCQVGFQAAPLPQQRRPFARFYRGNAEERRRGTRGFCENPGR